MESIPASLLARWKAYNAVEPIGHGDKMTGVIATLLSAFVGSTVSVDERGIHPFMPWQRAEG